MRGLKSEILLNSFIRTDLPEKQSDRSRNIIRLDHAENRSCITAVKVRNLQLFVKKNTCHVVWNFCDFQNGQHKSHRIYAPVLSLIRLCEECGTCLNYVNILYKLNILYVFSHSFGIYSNIIYMNIWFKC